MDSTSPPSLSAIEREIIADIQAVCRRCGWPTDVRPKFEAYLDRRGHFYEKQIKRLGGWKKLCARGGMRAGLTPALRLRHDAVAPDFDSIVADVRRVAQSLRLKPGAGLTCAVYHRSGGLYGPRTVSKFGWATLSAAAGVPSRPGHNREPRRQWIRVQSTLTQRDLDAALDRALGRTPLPRGFRRVMGGKRAPGRGYTALHRQVPELERGEVIADIRQVALSLGLLSPRLLTFDTYRQYGGRYTHEQTLALGGFDALRRVA